MSDSNAPEARPYHHGDLRRALVDAARQLLETEGPAAMSLRAVARQAGVSPAAPYHHFKDKAELMVAIANEGWAVLSREMFEARGNNPHDPLASVMTYIGFARARPALYRVMFDAARENETMLFGIKEDDGPYARFYDQLLEARRGSPDADIELDVLAAWASSHGLAEMASFRQFGGLKEMLGGEEPFIRAVLERMGRHIQLR